MLVVLPVGPGTNGKRLFRILSHGLGSRNRFPSSLKINTVVAGCPQVRPSFPGEIQ